MLDIYWFCTWMSLWSCDEKINVLGPELLGGKTDGMGGTMSNILGLAGVLQCSNYFVKPSLSV